MRKSSKKIRARIDRLVKKNARTIFGLLFVILGFIFLFKLPIIESAGQQARNLEPISASSEFKKNENSDIVRILVPKRDIDLRVLPSKIVNGYWETSEKTASHGEGTANPGEGGNVVVFAHAKEGLFYNLKDIKKDNIIYIFTKDKWFQYKVNEIKTVYPKDVTVVAPTTEEVLTLFTCSGFFDEKRLIVKAYPVN